MILGTEINEFVSNRHLSKIQFLQQENNQLQEYIQDLENALRLNKQAMKINFENTSNLKKKPTILDSSISNVNTTIYSNSQDQKQQLEKYELLVKTLTEENSSLLECLTKLQKQSTATSTKALLQEQISEETLNFYKDLIQEHEEKLLEMKRNIHDKEYAIQELERMKPIQEKDGQLIKIVEIVTPSEQTLKMHEELENIRQVLCKISSEGQTISEQNKMLREVNYVTTNVQYFVKNLKREVFKLRIVLRSQVAHYILKDFVFNEYIDRNDANLQLTYEIQSHRSKLEQLNQEAYGSGSLGYGFSAEPQQLKYLSKNERMIYQEKLHKMEMMLKGFKELFEKEKQMNMEISGKYNELKKQIVDLLDANELLIKSNQIKEEKIQKLITELQFYKKQSVNYMEILKSRRNFNSVQLQQEQVLFMIYIYEFNKDIAIGVFSPRFTQSQTPSQKHVLFTAIKKPSQQSTDFDTLKVINEEANQIDYKLNENNQEIKEESLQIPLSSTRQISKKPKLKQLVIDETDELNQAIIEEKNYCFTSREVNKEQRKKLSDNTYLQYYEMSKQECKDFLLNMAQEFNKNFGVQISNIKKKQLMDTIKECENYMANKELKLNSKLRRSNSDPYVYFSKAFEDHVITFRKPNKSSALAITKNEIHIILKELQDRKSKQNLKQQQLDPFQIDISQIDDRKEQAQIPSSSRNKPKNFIANAELSFVTNSQDENEDDLFDEN